MRRLLAVALLCLFSLIAQAHRLDEYLQATLFSIEPGTVQGTMRLVPGVAVAPQIIASIDSDSDGVLSPEEQTRYAGTVLSDLQLRMDDRTLQPHLLSSVFPSVEEMKRGTGEIKVVFAATFTRSKGRHELFFVNHHRPELSVYLVNSLVPNEHSLQLGTQDRNQIQSAYRVVLFEDSSQASPRRSGWSGFGGAFLLGMRHIVEGTDHLLFLLVLLLPAPLLVVAGRWRRRESTKRTLLHVLRIVTAFTLGHSLTLALSAFGVVRLSSRPVEVLIAVSIFVSAIHAIRPLFPGREATVAAFFGLIHGLAFASALNELGISGWYRMVSLFGFNLGIEAMQLGVVAVALPAFLVLSRTELYRPFRMTAACFALLASTAWIFERITDRPNEIGGAIAAVSRHGLVLAVALWAAVLLAWLISRLAFNNDAEFPS